jgi:uncharacterized protein YjiS (DUF1127 family)
MLSISCRSHLGRELLRRVLQGLLVMPARAVRNAAEWLEYRRQIRQLSELDSHLLRDIGITEADRRAAIVTLNRKQTGKER